MDLQTSQRPGQDLGTRPSDQNFLPWSRMKPPSTSGSGDALLAIALSCAAHRKQAKQGVRRGAPSMRHHVETAKMDWKEMKWFIGHVICLGSGLAPWHVLPVFLDLKIAADPALPNLTASNLPISSTAMFLGWLAGSLALKRCMEVWTKPQLVAGSACGLLVVALATVIVPHLSAGNLVIFTGIRFVYGILMNITGIQVVHVQDSMPGRENQVSVALNVGYCVILILMSWMCRGPTSNWDWRFEALLWYGVPICLGLTLGFPNLTEVLKGTDMQRYQTPFADSDEAKLSQQEVTSTISFAVTFLACGCGFYGLSYSAGKLSSDVYWSTLLLAAADIAGYLAALLAGSWGRARVQGASFALAAACLFACSCLGPGTPWAITSAMIGRLCLDVCFTTVYLGLAQSFSESAQKTVLPVCEVTARLGGIVAPYCGTLPAAVSCRMFGAVCLAAAWATGHQAYQEKSSQGTQDEAETSISSLRLRARTSSLATISRLRARTSSITFFPH